MPSKKSANISNGPVKMESLVPVMAELDRAVIWAYSLTGDRPENSKKIVVVVQTRGQRKSCLGYFKKEGWETKDGESVHEISISAEFLSRDPLEVIGTVIHEVGHLWNSDMDIKDCSDGGRHNKKFQEAAEMLGLVCTKGSNGLNHTEFGDELKEKIEKEFKPDYDAFRLAKKIILKPSKDPTMVKWQCKDKCTIVRVSAKVRLQATCEKCSEEFTRDPEALPLPEEVEVAVTL